MTPEEAFNKALGPEQDSFQVTDSAFASRCKDNGTPTVKVRDLVAPSCLSGTPPVFAVGDFIPQYPEFQYFKFTRGLPIVTALMVHGDGDRGKISLPLQAVTVHRQKIADMTDDDHYNFLSGFIDECIEMMERIENRMLPGVSTGQNTAMFVHLMAQPINIHFPSKGHTGEKDGLAHGDFDEENCARLARDNPSLEILGNLALLSMITNARLDMVFPASTGLVFDSPEEEKIDLSTMTDEQRECVSNVVNVRHFGMLCMKYAIDVVWGRREPVDFGPLNGLVDFVKRVEKVLKGNFVVPQT